MTISEPPIIGILRSMGHRVFLTGSRAVLDEVPEDRDYDWVVWLIGDIGPAMALIQQAGYVKEPEGTGGGDYGPAEGSFSSWRYGQVNLILTTSPTLAINYRHATALARRLKLTERKDRVTLFKAILYDDYPLYPSGLGWDTTPNEVRNGD